MYTHRLMHHVSIDHYNPDTELVIKDLEEQAVQEAGQDVDDWYPGVEIDIKEMNIRALDEMVKNADDWTPGMDLSIKDMESLPVYQAAKYKEEIVGLTWPMCVIYLMDIYRSCIIHAMQCLEL